MLDPAEVHIWRFQLDCSPAQLRTAAGWLTPDERARVARFRFQQLRDHATVARGMLRSVLGRYLGCDPAELLFAYGAFGKPYVPGEALEFNLAHSAGLGVCALSLGQPTGVDVERIRSDLDYEGIARHSFSNNERAVLASLGSQPANDGCFSAPPSDGWFAERVRDGFFRCWARKEAYIKGRGGGLSIPLDSFDVPLGATPVPQPVFSREAAPAAQGWCVRELDMGPTFAAAVALQAPDWRIADRGWLTLDDTR